MRRGFLDILYLDFVSCVVICDFHSTFRHSGVKTKIDRLLREFSSNAWAVQLTREAFSEHDVANALKRFVYMEIINR